MKKFYIIALTAALSLTASAQKKLYVSTYNGTNVEKYDGTICDVTVNRYMFTGWNTVALPFDVTEEELNETFGNDCRLEKLVSVENVGNDIQLNFQDCKAEGMTANMPYILYFTGEPCNKTLTKEACVKGGQAAIALTTQRGESVVMSGVQAKTAGIGFWGILAKDNAEAKFAKVDGSLSGFLATRCYIQLQSETALRLITNHVAAGETTSINAIAKNGEKVDVFTLGGQKVAAGINANAVNSLQPGIYVVKGQKVLVK